MNMKKFSKKIRCLSENPCNGELHLKTIKYKLNVKGKIIAIPDIEVWECNLCREHFYPYESSKKIDLYKQYSGKIMLRINPEIHSKLVQIAKKHHRSLNQEINYLLRKNTLTHKNTFFHH
ncbi:type II toxin-antitoxin system HicB family antitoxin [bacterium]|nr:type II toxin-antitoxin system HicB family antitoxin [bacterium]MBU1752850.1 type II toxin-antitoxin system HicB family antitoxin [bacterium]